MRAVVYEAFAATPAIRNVQDPSPAPHGVVVRVMANGVCRSDWHGWMGHDADITLPHVPGHELAGTVEAVGANVRNWRIGDRVTVPFVGGCGDCPECRTGNGQVCDHQFQPGFTHWGSFAEYVGIHYADLNLVALPQELTFDVAASLGCRFATSFRAVVDQGRVRPGEWVAVHGCGGVGLSAIMIANGLGARVIGIDIAEDKLALARLMGAEAVINAAGQADVVGAVHQITGGGAHVSIDALGHRDTCINSILNLKKRGRHVQVGLMLAEHAAPPIPMGPVIANELEIYGSHGMQAHRYDAMMAMILSGRLAPEKLITSRISLDQSIEALTGMGAMQQSGVTVITAFSAT